jgi:hypothetical protein
MGVAEANCKDQFRPPHGPWGWFGHPLGPNPIFFFLFSFLEFGHKGVAKPPLGLWGWPQGQTQKNKKTKKQKKKIGFFPGGLPKNLHGHWGDSVTTKPATPYFFFF